jgi:hypothetical protein
MANCHHHPHCLSIGTPYARDNYHGRVDRSARVELSSVAIGGGAGAWDRVYGPPSEASGAGNLRHRHCNNGPAQQLLSKGADCGEPLILSTCQPIVIACCSPLSPRRDDYKVHANMSACIEPSSMVIGGGANAWDCVYGSPSGRNNCCRRDQSWTTSHPLIVPADCYCVLLSSVALSDCTSLSPVVLVGIIVIGVGLSVAINTVASLSLLLAGSRYPHVLSSSCCAREETLCAVQNLVTLVISSF